MPDNLKRLYIEPTSKCNLACTMCFRNAWVGESFSDMDANVFDKIMETMPEGVDTIFFGGMGEPLHHKDILYMVSETAKRVKRVELLTNGTLLTREMSRELIDAGLDMLWVSIENFEEDAYGQVRIGGTFKGITDNLSAFNQERFKFEYAQRDFGMVKEEGQSAWQNSKDIRKIDLGLTFVAMKSNVHMLGGLSKFARIYNVDEVNISNVIPTDAASESEGLYTKVVNFKQGDPAHDSAPTFDLPYMDFTMPSVQEGLMGLLTTDNNMQIAGAALARKRRYCRFVEEGCCFIKNDGEVCPCMALLHSQKTWLDGENRIVYSHSFGNIREKSLADIWQSEDYTDFRDRVRTFAFSPCIGCGGCDNRETNEADCIGNKTPTCGACLWSEGIIACP